MKKVVIFGAAGHTGKYLTRKMQETADIELSVLVQNPAKFGDMDMTGVHVIQWNALNAEHVRRAMEGQDVLLCSLMMGNVLTIAKNIVAALAETSVKRIIWITGIDFFHNAVEGELGVMLNLVAKQRTDNIEAVDTIAASNAVTTILHCPSIRDGDNEVYMLMKEDKLVLLRNVVDRAAIAQCMADMIHDETLGRNKSLSITNAKVCN